jgi:hypothetical protein
MLRVLGRKSVAEIGLAGQAASILKAIFASLKDMKLLASQETVEKRAVICETCPKLKVKNGKYACVTCGCSFKRKIAVQGASCPLGKW